MLIDNKRSKRKQEKGLNAAAIWCFARKLRAQEWARALGKGIKDPRMGALERKAVEYATKSERERQRVENEQKRLAKQRRKLEMWTRLLRTNLAGQFFENSKERSEFKNFIEARMDEVGRVLGVIPVDNGWITRIEPWEEVRARNLQRKASSPIVVYRVKMKLVKQRIELISIEREAEA